MFSDAFPSLYALVIDGLKASGDHPLGEAIGSHVVRRVTYDESVNGGYINFGSDLAQVDHTIALPVGNGLVADMANVDVAHDGTAFGVEVFPTDCELKRLRYDPRIIRIKCCARAFPILSGFGTVSIILHALNFSSTAGCESAFQINPALLRLVFRVRMGNVPQQLSVGTWS